MELKAAMQAIRKDDTKARAFLKDPAGTLKSLGVDVSKHNITKSTAVPTGATHDACVSAGCGACVSVG